MAKYDESFKLKVIQDYLSESAGAKSLAKRYGIDHAAVRKWVAAYRAHGPASFDKKCAPLSGQEKLSILRHMWQHELSYRQTAALFNIGAIASIVQWEQKYRDGGIEALSKRRMKVPLKMPKSPPIPVDKPSDDQRTREQLLEELKYLRMENAYLKKLDALIQAKRQATQNKKHK